MFGKRCTYCDNKIKNSYRFCPHCGHALKEGVASPDDLKDWGMLGQQDLDFGNDVKLPRGFDSLFNFFLNGLLGSAKDIEKGLKKKQKKTPKKGFSISISTASGKPPQIKLVPLKDSNKKTLNGVAQKKKNLLKKNLKNFSELPREEPLTAIRRFSDKVVYEIELPGVKSLEDVSISELEHSLEIRAISKERSFFKILPINLPIVESNLKKGKLVLELALEE